MAECLALKARLFLPKVLEDWIEGCNFGLSNVAHPQDIRRAFTRMRPFSAWPVLLGPGALPAEPLQNDADLLLGGKSSTGGLTNLFDDVWGHNFLLWVVP